MPRLEWTTPDIETSRDDTDWEKGTKMIQERRNKKAAINTSRTRAEKAKAQAEYTDVNKQVKRSIRTDKRKYVEDLTTTAENAAREGNMRELYDTTKILSGNHRKPERSVKSKEDKVIANIEEQRNRWVEYFKELLKRPAPLNPSNIEAALTDLPINVGPPTIQEINVAIRQIKSSKAAGPDNIPAESLKADVETSTSDGKRGIPWTSRMQLDDLDFADDLALLSQTQQQMQEKTTIVAAASAAVGLNIHNGKSKILRYNTACTNPITIDGEDLEDVKTFTYLGSIIDEQGGSDAGCEGADRKSKSSMSTIEEHLELKPTTVLLYGAETWRITKAIIQENTGVYQQLSTQNTSDLLARHYRQRPTVGDNKPDPSGGRNQEEALEVDRTHIEESTQLRHKTRPHMESSWRKEERKTKEHITPGNGDRHEKNEQKLDKPGKKGPGQSGLENAGRRPMLH
ncbi:unnamed protein product [Schistosoma mattheei]|uniref:Uncharacterized protein n=1 Tax=Schistosoma mattheei TaxID=31246 RepID=A0A183PC13_9TREM|nr:unnamed protein product [Schistosoma mattheei]